MRRPPAAAGPRSTCRRADPRSTACGRHSSRHRTVRGRFPGTRFVVNMEHPPGRLTAMTATLPERRRWLALYVLCLGVLMIVLDTTIVNVALPSIRSDLKFSDTSLAWVVNAYMLTFGGFLLLGGKLGDLYGHRRLFLLGITLFTLASLACGLASTQVFLITARAIQGLGGATVTAVALSLIIEILSAPGGRAKA